MIKLSVQVSYKKQATLGIIGVIILLLVIEVIANVWWLTQINCEFEQNEIFQGINEKEKRQLCLDFYDLKTTGDELIPNQVLDSMTINSLGFRGSEFSEIKPSNTYRIFMVGGSTMFGAGATSDETTIPGYLQQFLDEYNLGFNLEVINAGIQGADSNAEFNLMEKKLLAFSPDLILVYDGWNDLRASNTPDVLKENWESMCKLGNENNFDVIIALQPIAGFGNKVLTKQESKYAQSGLDYNKSPLSESFSVYQDYGKKLEGVNSCVKTVDLRNVFDAESEPIYWDEAHVSDRGNNIVGKSLNTVIFPIVSQNHQLDIFEQEKNIERISSLIYDGREITVTVELLSSTESENKTLKIIAHDNTNDKIIQNVTYFLSISKDNENLLRKYFFAEDGILLIDVQPKNDPLINVIGEKQYDHDAYVMPGSKYSPEMSGENLTSVTPLQMIGSIFDIVGVYTFDIELRTIDNRQNWVFSLSGFNSQITIEKDLILEDSMPNQPDDLLRIIFSNYKTPILLNEIFKW